MSTKIKLWFIHEPRLIGKEIRIYSTRLLGAVQFLEGEDWGEPAPAIIDTGAPISIIPMDIWQKARVDILTSTRLWGVVPKKECSLKVNVGKISLRLIDRTSISKRMDIIAYLAPTNKVKLIIGFEGMLHNFNVFFSSLKNEAFIEVI